jgi:PIN domain nuclease of toxin-antitoxin system
MAGGNVMLLDTCALLWLAAGGGQLSPTARSRIAGADALHISAITGFEIAIKGRSGKLKLPAMPSEWLRTVLDHHGIDVVPLDLAICVAATELPLVHRDPCDRFIIATARAHGWPVVTADARFRDYGIEVVW